MKRKQLLFLSLAVAFFSLVQVQAVTVPYIQALQSFGGESANLSTFTPIPGDYTLEVQGAVGTQITIAGIINYTPTSNPTVRFVQKKGVVYVYEGNTYMTSIKPDYSAIFPVIADANVTTDANNLLQNASFETTGTLVGGTNYNFGSPWVTNATIGTSGGIRIQSGTAGNLNGTYECVWRGTGNSTYFAQPVSTAILPNTFYKVVVNQLAGSNSAALFNIGLGSTVDGIEYTSKTMLLANGKNGTQSMVLGTPSTISGQTYFTFKNSAVNTATAGTQTDALTQIDFMELIKGTFGTTGISNVTSATFLAGTAYSPELTLNFSEGDSYDMTPYIANQGFDNLRGEWLETPTANTGGYSFSEVEFYNKTYNLSQALTNLPAGVYKLKAQGFERAAANDAGVAYNANTEVIQSKLYATSSVNTYLKSFNSLYSNVYQVAWGGTVANNYLNNMQAANGAFTAGYYDMQLENIMVGVDGALTIGAKKETNVTNSWALFDNFKLYYLGASLPVLNVNNSSLAFTPNGRTKSINITGSSLSTDVTLTLSNEAFKIARPLTIPKDSVMLAGGITFNVSCDANANITGENLTITSSGKTSVVGLSIADNLSLSTRSLFVDQSTQDSLLLTVSGDLYSNIDLTIPSGISLVKNVDETNVNSISVADALSGVVIKAKWDKTTRIVDQKIRLSTGILKDSVVVIALNDNKISYWDADTLTVSTSASLPMNSSLAGAGWTQNDGTGLDLGALSQLYNTSGGMRIVPMTGTTGAAHTYLGKNQAFGRSAYFRNFSAAAPFNSNNLTVNLFPSTTYVLRGVISWHNNGISPNVTLSVNTGKSALGSSLGSDTKLLSVKQAGVDFGFEFTTPADITQYYLVLSADQAGDCMVSPDYLSIYPKNQVLTASNQTKENRLQYSVENQMLKVKNVNQYSVFNLQGVKVYDVNNNTESTSVRLNQGIYIIKSNNAVEKLIVR